MSPTTYSKFHILADLSCVFLVMFMASFSTAVPFEDAADGTFPNNLPLSGLNGFFDSPVDASNVLAFNSEINPQSNNLNINPGTPESSNSNSDGAILDDLGSPIPLDESMPSTPFNSEIDNKNIDRPTTFDSGLGTYYPDPIMTQNSVSSCATDGTQDKENNMCASPTPDSYIRVPPGARATDPNEYPESVVKKNNALKTEDNRFLDTNPDWPVDFDEICKSYSTPGLSWRPFPLCCIGPRLALIGLEHGLEVTNEGNCLTWIRERPWCLAAIALRPGQGWYCCKYMKNLMNWGWAGMNCVPAM